MIHWHTSQKYALPQQDAYDLLNFSIIMHSTHEMIYGIISTYATYTQKSMPVHNGNSLQVNYSPLCTGMDFCVCCIRANDAIDQLVCRMHS